MNNDWTLDNEYRTLMEAKEPIVKLLKSLQEIDIPVQRQLLIDYMLGRRSRQIEEYGLSDKDTYGIGETHDEDFWSTIIDTAYEGGLLKQMATKNDALIPTSAGKKFIKKPTSIVIPDDESIAESESDDSEIDSLLEQAQKERAASSLSASPHAKQQIKLITAVDRHIALDSFAESEGLGLDEVLDDLEELASQSEFRSREIYRTSRSGTSGVIPPSFRRTNPFLVPA